MIDTTQIAVALGRDIQTVPDATRLQWQMWIDDAALTIEFGDGVHSGLGDLALLNQSQLDYVIREAVTAKVKRPDDATQVDISVDDGRVSKIYQTGTGTVYIRPEWWKRLDPDVNVDSQAFSTRPGFEPGRRYWPAIDRSCW